MMQMIVAKCNREMVRILNDYNLMKGAWKET